jgi:hypothetical protein
MIGDSLGLALRDESRLSLARSNPKISAKRWNRRRGRGRAIFARGPRRAPADHWRQPRRALPNEPFIEDSLLPTAKNWRAFLLE